MKKQRHSKRQDGYTLIYLLAVLSVLGLLMGQSLHEAANGARTSRATKLRSERYYNAEDAISHAVSWLRVNSQSLLTPYRREEFYTRFVRTAPSAGANDVGIYGVPTKVKLFGTTDSAVLLNDSTLATAAFPVTRDITTNATFPAQTSFNAHDFGGASVRITLVDAIAGTPAKDYGPPPALLPETDFYPIYRIDAMTALDRGSYVYSSVSGKLIHVFDWGIYGQDYLEINQPCDSFKSAVADYSSSTKRANCPAGSNSTAAVQKNEEVYGNLATNGSIEADPPFGGNTCADFTPGCPNKGETCAGEDCGVPLLEDYDPWTVYCPSEIAAVTYSSNTTLSIVDSDLGDQVILPADRCWDKITVDTNTTLTLNSVNSPYYIETLELKNNSNSKLNINPGVAGGVIEIYVNKIIGDAINGNQAINSTGKATQFKMYYLGTSTLTLNGSAEMKVAIVAPNAEVQVTGSFEYYGALLAKRLLMTGSGGVHYDESLGGSGPIVDTQYRMKELVEFYR